MEFKGFPKIARWSRDIVITEKIDGTNAAIVISDDGNQIAAQSRNRLITPGADNFGFARWVFENREELLYLGPGYHFGEWWGSGIQRGYGLDHKRFSLFPSSRRFTPSICFTVPILYEGPLLIPPVGNPFPIVESGIVSNAVHETMNRLRDEGSLAAPGFMNPEGIIIYHTASRALYKKTFTHDQDGKGTTGE